MYRLAALWGVDESDEAHFATYWRALLELLVPYCTVQDRAMKLRCNRQETFWSIIYSM